VGLVTIFYCLRFETSPFVASYDSQGYGGGIRPRLRTGADHKFFPVVWRTNRLQVFQQRCSRLRCVGYACKPVLTLLLQVVIDMPSTFQAIPPVLNKHVFVRMGKNCTPASGSSTLPRRTRPNNGPLRLPSVMSQYIYIYSRAGDCA
jgi:hypothetical protein